MWGIFHRAGPWIALCHRYLPALSLSVSLSFSAPGREVVEVRQMVKAREKAPRAFVFDVGWGAGLDRWLADILFFSSLRLPTNKVSIFPFSLSSHSHSGRFHFPSPSLRPDGSIIRLHLPFGARGARSCFFIISVRD